MYEDKETLERYKKTWLTKECHDLIKRERKRLFKEEERTVSLQKIINNLILEKYEMEKRTNPKK